MGVVNNPWFHLLIVFLFFATFAHSDDCGYSVLISSGTNSKISLLDAKQKGTRIANQEVQDDCVYTVLISTGTIEKAGTDSKISLNLMDANHKGIRISNLEVWGGMMGPKHDYFENGNLDAFSGHGRCLKGPVCYLNITSDGTAPNAEWYLKFVQVTVSGPNNSYQHFVVNQWLAIDYTPNQLYAIRDYCGTHDEL